MKRGNEEPRGRKVEDSRRTKCAEVGKQTENKDNGRQDVKEHQQKKSKKRGTENEAKEEQQQDNTRRKKSSKKMGRRERQREKAEEHDGWVAGREMG